MKIHAIQTGLVKIKEAQRVRRSGGMLNVLLSSEWSEWLPIYAWVIEHSEGIIVVDTGETARTAEQDYFTAWHPYYKLAVQMRVRKDDEMGPALRRIGVDPRSVDKVILTHLHTDHAGGLYHFPKSEIIVSEEHLRSAEGIIGKLQGYLPQHWPGWFDPTPIRFEDGPFGPFDASHNVTESGDVVLVPTPGHTPGHLSVVVNDGELSYFLAGDVTYSEETLLARQPDGVSPSPGTALDTIDRVLALATARPTVYLPSHDPLSAHRLSNRTTIRRAVVEVAS